MAPAVLAAKIHPVTRGYSSPYRAPQRTNKGKLKPKAMDDGSIASRTTTSVGTACRPAPATIESNPYATMTATAATTRLRMSHRRPSATLRVERWARIPPAPIPSKVTHSIDAKPCIVPPRRCESRRAQRTSSENDAAEIRNAASTNGHALRSDGAETSLWLLAEWLSGWTGFREGPASTSAAATRLRSAADEVDADRPRLGSRRNPPTPAPTAAPSVFTP